MNNKPGKMSRKIDVHAHMIPDFYVKLLKEKGINGALWTPFPEWSPEKDLEIMQKNRIKKRFLSLSIPGVFFEDKEFVISLSRKCNEYAASLVQKYPDRYGAFGVLPFPYIDSSLSEIEYVLDTLKLDGVVFFSNVNSRYYGEDDYKDLFYELNKRKAVVFLHPEDYKISYGKYRILAPIIDRVMDTGRALLYLFMKGRLNEFENIYYITAHGGGSFPYLIKSLENNNEIEKSRYEKIKNRIFFDTAQQGESLFAFLKKFCGSSRILIGTDGGWQNPLQISMTLRSFDKYPGFNKLEKRLIEYENAFELFPGLKLN